MDLRVAFEKWKFSVFVGKILQINSKNNIKERLVARMTNLGEFSTWWSLLTNFCIQNSLKYYYSGSPLSRVRSLVDNKNRNICSNLNHSMITETIWNNSYNPCIQTYWWQINNVGWVILLMLQNLRLLYCKITFGTPIRDFCL